MASLDHRWCGRPAGSRRSQGVGSNFLIPVPSSSEHGARMANKNFVATGGSRILVTGVLSESRRQDCGVFSEESNEGCTI
jgi:hypothetical protein